MPYITTYSNTMPPTIEKLYVTPELMKFDQKLVATIQERKRKLIDVCGSRLICHNELIRITKELEKKF